MFNWAKYTYSSTQPKLILNLYLHNYRREALYIWKKRNGSSATYSKSIKIFEQADCKKYADEVRRIVQLSDSKTDDSSSGSGEEQSQPQTYPASKPQLLSQVPSAMHKPGSTEVYVMVKEQNLPEGKSLLNYTSTK